MSVLNIILGLNVPVHCTMDEMIGFFIVVKVYIYTYIGSINATKPPYVINPSLFIVRFQSSAVAWIFCEVTYTRKDNS